MTTTVQGSFARPANTTAYAAGDLVANSATAGEVAAIVLTTSRVLGQGTISRVRFYKSAPSATNATFTVHLFTAEPTVTNGDNGALAIDTAANHIGSVECDLTAGAIAGTVGLSRAIAITNGISFDLASIASGERRLYALIEAEAAYTPASGETFAITLEIIN